jgi:hypothetical protein
MERGASRDWEWGPPIRCDKKLPGGVRGHITLGDSSYMGDSAKKKRLIEARRFVIGRGQSPKVLDKTRSYFLGVTDYVLWERLHNIALQPSTVR